MGYLVSLALHPGFSDLWRSPPALSSSFLIHHPFTNTASQATFGYLLLTVQHLLLATPVVTDTSHPPFTTSATDFRVHFLPCPPSCFIQGLPGAGSSTSKVAGLHVDLWNSPGPTIVLNHSNPQKRYTIRFYLCAQGLFEVRVPQPWDLLLTGLEPEFLKVTCNDSCLSWQLGYRVLRVLINK